MDAAYDSASLIARPSPMRNQIAGPFYEKEDERIFIARSLSPAHKDVIIE
jgi:hypothetical protein